MAEGAALAAREAWQESDRNKRASRHIYNKLNSIDADSKYVRRLAVQLPQYLLVANLRCGAWYTEPSLTSSVSYFKSTDGHMHQWGFSLKRNNLHLLPDLLDASGCIIVDSTRRGKSMPDALSKTIPIWCAVLNRASRKLHGSPAEDGTSDLLTPSWMIPPTEHDQIEGRIESFVDSLLSSDLQMTRLSLPLRPIFCTPQHVLPSPKALKQLEETCIPIVVVSASRRVDPSSQPASDLPYVYVQGAGDDHENWARGLTPDLFWAHHDFIMACSYEDIEGVVDDLVRKTDTRTNKHWFTPRLCLVDQMSGVSLATQSESHAGDVEIGHTGIFTGSRSAPHTFNEAELKTYDLIVHITSRPPSEGVNPASKVVRLHMTPNKKGLASIRTLFPASLNQVHATLIGSEHASVLICCEDGKDLSGALAVAVLTCSFDESRSLITDMKRREVHCNTVTKDDTRRRLQWLVSSNPRAGPGRAFLLRVNELLLSRQYRNGSKTSSSDIADNASHLHREST